MNHHRYIYDKGKFIRDFDTMYSNIDDPHGQKASSSNLSHKLYIKILQEIIANNKGNKWYDFGCGLGYFTKVISKYFEKVSVTGIDISESAINKINNDNFKCGDVLNKNFISKLDKSDTISFFESLYYFNEDEIPIVKENVDQLLKNDGHLIATYHLPVDMNYGRYITSLNDLKEFFRDYKLVYGSDFTDNHSKNYDGNYFGRHLFAIFQKI
tara:strand:- start:524 stop:1159 length:636 start_codon:yes stop_codon:yes gene_type:complete